MGEDVIFSYLCPSHPYEVCSVKAKCKYCKTYLKITRCEQICSVLKEERIGGNRREDYFLV